MKKIILTLIVLIITPIIIYYGFYFIQNLTMKKSFVNYNEGSGKDIFIRCDYNIFYPKFAYPFNLDLVSDDGYEFNKKMISFHSPVHLFSQTKKEWETSYIGGTTIENTTFPELVKMVKEDCSQFQKAKGDPKDETINWSYSPAPTEDELDEQTAMSFWNTFGEYLPEAQTEFIGIYGNPYGMTDAELAQLYNKIQEEGMDERVYIKEMTTRFYNTMENITDAQKKKLLDVYGDWEGLTDKELADLATRIQEELLSGEVSLD
jgi:hypothetical protein